MTGLLHSVRVLQRLKADDHPWMIDTPCMKPIRMDVERSNSTDHAGVSPRATCWNLRTRKMGLGRLPLLMGIVNVTPDSFSDGDRFLAPEAAVQHGLALVEQGADILDVGGESTRPYATPVDFETELGRVRGVLSQLCAQCEIPISIDTSKFEVAQLAIDCGAEIVNDVKGLEGDPRMARLVADSDAAVCVMHMHGTPSNMQDNPTYENVVDEIHLYLQQRRDALVKQGVRQDRICLDPGIGFGKTHQHNLTLLAHCHEFHDLGCPVLVGHSRKGFIGKVLADKKADSTFGTVGVALSLARQGVQIIRVHDVAAVRQALLLFEAAGGLD